MRHLLTPFLVLIPLNCFNQHWEIINPDYKYNYEKHNSNIINSTVWVDSFKIEGDDTIFFLNRIVSDCDTCAPYINGYPQIAFYDSPQFMQKEVTKTESFYYFRSPNNFIIKHNAKLNDNWVFDTINNLSAKILLIKEADILGLIDSVKIIVVPDNDTIILSKSFGIIRFDAIYDTYRYDLAGIDYQIGETMPKLHDFFNFSAGDIFEYHGDYWSVENETKFYIEKVTVNTKNQNGDTLEYEVTIQYYERIYELPPDLWYSPECASSKTYNTTWKFVNNTNHPTNCFNNQLVRINEYLERNNCEGAYYYTKLIVGKDSNHLFIKTVGSFDSYDFYNIQDTTNKIFYRFRGLCDEHEVRYKVGLGEVHHRTEGFEWYTNRDLAAYRKGNDTIGVFTDDAKLIVGVKDIFEQEFIIYPNPANDFINIISPNNSLIKCISIVNMSGQIFRSASNSSTISIWGLKSGIYFIKIEYNNTIVYKKIIINAS